MAYIRFLPFITQKLHTHFAKQLWSYGSLLVLLASWFWLLPHSLVDFDTHHDGYMLAQAIGLRGGLSIHTEVSAQYGPMTPLSQSWFLLLPFSEAVSLRLWTVTHLSLTAYLIADLNRVWPRNVMFPRGAFLLAAAIWILASDVPAIGYMLPWSSVQATFLSVLSLHLLLASEKRMRSSPKVGARFGFLAGFVIGLIPFSRINVGWALVLAMILLWGFNLKWRFIDHRTISQAIAGIFVSTGLVILFLVSQGALDDYVLQAVIQPFLWALNATSATQWNTLYGISVILFSTLPALLLTAFAMFLLSSRKFWVIPTWINLRIQANSYVLPAVLGLMTTLLLANPRTVTDGIIGGSMSFTDLRTIASRTIFEAQGSVVYFLIFLSLAIWVIHLFVERRKSGSTAEFFQATKPIFLVGIFSIANLVQLVPTYDGRHAWWGSALAPVVLLASSCKLFKPTVNQVRFLASWLIIQVLLVGLLASANLEYPRFAAPQGSPLSGLQLRADDLYEVEEAQEVMQRLPEKASALFISNDGFIPVAGGAYRASTRDFVWWSSPGVDIREISMARDYLGETLVAGDYLVYQDKAIGDVRVSEFVTMVPELDVVYCNENLCLLQAPKNWPEGLRSWNPLPPY